ncbi:amidohydrolase family protein [Clostridium sp. AM58-1XD]|uniref:amidohydrolase family protein n=1 Tax=Clostridium sp. AM58-1XD TaxID=2292307 RepID=UPI000E4FBAC2|nr:amidohydrolase family protein [Clostridium sp. AM58-1XD]RGY94902.1 amidohydrolase [Clostridium sp. AM58-1XD]
MKIIDAHLHFCPGYEYFDEIAEAAGHENTESHLKEIYENLGIAGGIVMGNHGLSLEEHQYPEFLKYCIGLDSSYMAERNLTQAYDLIEKHLQRERCVGIKLYPGYSPYYVSDQIYEPVYELAQMYRKPVAVHMGETAGSNAYLKYSHPLTLDETAADHPQVTFVMCHFGNPWLMDAAAVIGKNENVAADISGLLEGKIDTTEFLNEQRGYIEALRTWISYLRNYGKIMFGTDWPLANLEDYIQFTKEIIPEKYWEDVFWKSASRIYGI